MSGFRADAARLRGSLAVAEAGVYSASDAARVVEELVATINACEAAKARFAVQVASGGEHRRLGFADASDWLASVSGSTTRDARDALALVSAVEACSETRDALVAGEVSIAQAREIARTEAAVPGSEAGLLDVARGKSLGALRDAARDQRVRAIPAEQLHREQRRVREVRHWRDDLGMVCGRFRLTPAVGVAFVNRLDAETDRVRRAAKRGSGELESRDAYAADAFTRMITGQGKGHATRADVVLAVDYRAYQRGHTHDGEPSHIIGGGPVPVSVVRELANDAFLKVAFHDGVEIHKIMHFGRHRPAELETALGLGPPPDFAGVTCSEEGCERRYGLQWDHVDPVANNGPTSRENLKATCTPHHWEKTERDRAAGLLNGKAKAKANGTGRAPP